MGSHQSQPCRAVCHSPQSYVQYRTLVTASKVPPLTVISPNLHNATHTFTHTRTEHRENAEAVAPRPGHAQAALTEGSQKDHTASHHTAPTSAVSQRLSAHPHAAGTSAPAAPRTPPARRCRSEVAARRTDPPETSPKAAPNRRYLALPAFKVVHYGFVGGGTYPAQISRKEFGLMRP